MFQKIFFLAFLLFSASSAQFSENIFLQKSSESLTTIDLGARKLQIPENLASFFAGKDLSTPYAMTTALIVYVDKNGKQISDFAHIDEDSTAHIFAESYCYNRGNLTISLESSHCDAEKCEFPQYENFTIEELEKKRDLFDLLEVQPWKTQGVYLWHEKSGKIPLVFAGAQDCNDGKKL